MIRGEVRDQVFDLHPVKMSNWPAVIPNYERFGYFSNVKLDLLKLNRLDNWHTII